uniref:Protein tyrosine phosphatase receptor type N n=1 Tax=Paramormyrops kingsleyae TaxID=1676925 RepID=A0A3B3TE97_9TELE
MRRPRLWTLLCLMTICYQLGMSSRYEPRRATSDAPKSLPRRDFSSLFQFGEPKCCLFERKLCPRGQRCLDDALFGQCQDSQQQRVQYQVSVPVLQKLQEVQKQLMMQGLSWQDDIVQYVISKELSRVPQSRTPATPWDGPPPQPYQPLDKSSSKPLPDMSQLNPATAQRYLDPVAAPGRPQASLRMQAPVPDPYTYRQFGYPDEEERSLNSLDGAEFARPSTSHSRAGLPRAEERGRQLLEDVLSLYLSPGQPSSRHQAGVSSRPIYKALDLPLDYSENLVLQEEEEEEVGSQPQQKKAPQNYGTLSRLDEATLNQLVGVLKRYGVSVKDLSPQQLETLMSALRPHPIESLKAPDRLQKAEATGKKALLTEGVMMHEGDRNPLPAPSVDLLPLQQPPPKGAPPIQAVTVGGAASGSKAMLSAENTGGRTVSKASSAALGGVDSSLAQEEYGYIVTNRGRLSLYDGVRLLETFADRIHLPASTFINISVVGPALMFRVRQNHQNLSANDVADKAVAEKTFLESETGLKILQTGVGERSDGRGLPQATRVQDGSRLVILTLVGVACVGGILAASLTVACLRHHARQLASRKLGLGPEAGHETHFEYQELCRQHMATKSSSRQDAGCGGGGGTDTSRVSSVSSQFSDAAQPSPSSHSSTPSWCEEPAQSNMDISTGHMILAYMEDHLKNRDRLLREWEALRAYQAEPSSASVAQSDSNHKKNRNPDFVPYNHSRVKLKAEINPSRADYINASTIIEHDPRMAAYIATQGPLPHTISDFWQMVWESGCTVIVMMTALVEDGEKQCDRYWPDEGSSLYHIYEVNLVSEHIWCNDFLVRSFYLKNVQTQETRTLTQFHFLSWPAQGIPNSTRPLLDFRRKVNKCYRGRSCPIIVHCSDGTGRTGTYILIDMVLNRMAKGVKEIDIAATLEHVRDQRPGMVHTKDQFEFALTAVAEEVNAILKALPQ